MKKLLKVVFSLFLIFLEKDREVARRLLKEGKKDRAKLLLRKKKYMVSSAKNYLLSCSPKNVTSYLSLSC